MSQIVHASYSESTMADSCCYSDLGLSVCTRGPGQIQRVPYKVHATELKTPIRAHTNHAVHHPDVLSCLTQSLCFVQPYRGFWVY